MYRGKDFCKRTEEMVTDKDDFSLKLIIIDLAKKNHDLSKELTKLRDKYE